MPPTEQKILTTFLLHPAPLPQIIKPSVFAGFFPKKEQASSEIKRLYRSLQHQRALLTDAVSRNIEAEVKRGKAQQSAVIRSRRAAETPELDDEVLIENALFGSTSNLPTSRPHTLSSIIPELNTASQEVSVELDSLEQEAEVLLADITSTIGGLSDLRYGKFTNGELKEEMLEGLERLNATCDRK